MDGTRVRRLEERDIDSAIALTGLEGWGYTPADFRRLLALSPDGCFAAERAGRVVGVLTTTSYDGLAFLGAVVVVPELRGQGIGKTMMLAALSHLRGKGVRTVRLNAVMNAIRFYEGLGFQREYEVIRWHGPAGAGSFGRVRPVRYDDLANISRMDAAVFGADRRILLDRLAEEFPTTFLVAERNGGIRGYIVGNREGDGCEIGPWVVEPGSGPVARDLYHALVAAAGPEEIGISGPSPNEDLLGFIRSAGHSEAFRTLRMRWGDDAFHDRPTAIWALAGLEKG